MKLADFIFYALFTSGVTETYRGVKETVVDPEKRDSALRYGLAKVQEETKKIATPDRIKIARDIRDSTLRQAEEALNSAATLAENLNSTPLRPVSRTNTDLKGSYPKQGDDLKRQKEAFEKAAKQEKMFEKERQNHLQNA